MASFGGTSASAPPPGRYHPIPVPFPVPDNPLGSNPDLVGSNPEAIPFRRGSPTPSVPSSPSWPFVSSHERARKLKQTRTESNRWNLECNRACVRAFEDWWDRPSTWDMADRPPPRPPSLHLNLGGERPPPAAEAAHWAAMMQAYYKTQPVPGPYFGPGPPHPSYAPMWQTPSAGPSYPHGAYFPGPHPSYPPQMPTNHQTERGEGGSAQDSSDTEESEETEPGKIVGGAGKRKARVGAESTGKKKKTTGSQGAGTGPMDGKTRPGSKDKDDGEEEEEEEGEKEAKKLKRKQSNRESARRSRLRKQAECEELSIRVDALNRENNRLRDELAQVNKVVASLLAERAMLNEQLKAVAGNTDANPEHLTNTEGVERNEGEDKGR